MSVRVIDRVWSCGRYSGGTLIVLLAMADWANDDGGRVFPTVNQLAEKSRMTTRQVRTCIRQLEDDQVIALVNRATGRPGQANEYRIVLSELQQVEAPETAHTTPSADGGRIFTPEICDTDGGNLRHGRRKSTTETAEICDTPIDNRQEQPSKDPSRQPSSAPRASQDGLPGFESNQSKAVLSNGKAKLGSADNRRELDAAYQAYNAVAQKHGWPVCQHRSTMRDGHLRRRMQDAGGLSGWQHAMERADASDHLCGRSKRSAGYENWVPDIDFFLQAKSFTGLMEGKYDNRGDGAKPNHGSSATRDAARAAAELLNRRAQGP